MKPLDVEIFVMVTNRRLEKRMQSRTKRITFSVSTNEKLFKAQAQSDYMMLLQGFSKHILEYAVSEISITAPPF